VSLKSVTTGVAAAALVGAAAVGVTSIASVPTVSPAITPVVFGAPLPLDNDPDLAGQLTGVLNQLANGATITENAGLIQGGVGILEGRTANRLLAQAHQNGDFPLNLAVTNVSPPAPDGSVTGTVNVSGPKTPPTSQQMTFMPGGPSGWQVSKSSAMSVMQAALSSSG
jgi:hypothetical protein